MNNCRKCRISILLKMDRTTFLEFVLRRDPLRNIVPLCRRLGTVDHMERAVVRRDERSSSPVVFLRAMPHNSDSKARQPRVSNGHAVRSSRWRSAARVTLARRSSHCTAMRPPAHSKANWGLHTKIKEVHEQPRRPCLGRKSRCGENQRATNG